MLRLAWQFAPTILVFVGAVLVALGGLWASWRQSNFNAKLNQKNEEIIRLQHENVQAVTGGDSYCFMEFMSASSPGRDIAFPVFLHRGRFPIYDVSARIVDLSEYRKLKDAGNDAAALKALQGTTFPLPNMTPGFAIDGGARLLHSEDSDYEYNIFFVARNGWWNESYRRRRTPQGWATAIRIQGLGKQELFLQVTPDFPRNENGEVEW